MQSLIADPIHIATSLYARGKQPFAVRHYTDTLAINSAGFDLDDPAIPREESGSIKRPPPGGLGCPACIDHVQMDLPSHGRNPRPCRWYDQGPDQWSYPSCKRDY
eukprot:893189-Pyramimonas_sp.AAC.1